MSVLQLIRPLLKRNQEILSCSVLPMPAGICIVILKSVAMNFSPHLKN